MRVLTHFAAEPAERGGGGPTDFLLGSDWQVDVTELVRESIRVLDWRVARLQEGAVLMGMDAGTTKVQVRKRRGRRGRVGMKVSETNRERKKKKQREKKDGELRT